MWTTAKTLCCSRNLLKKLHHLMKLNTSIKDIVSGFVQHGACPLYGVIEFPLWEDVMLVSVLLFNPTIISLS